MNWNLLAACPYVLHPCYNISQFLMQCFGSFNSVGKTRKSLMHLNWNQANKIKGCGGNSARLEIQETWVLFQLWFIKPWDLV